MNNRKKPISYKSKRSRKAGFSSTKNIVPTIVTIAAAGVICCFGYSIAKPILNSNDSISTNANITDESSPAEGTTVTNNSSVTTTKGTTGLVVLNGDKTVTTTTVTTTVTTSKNNDGSKPAVHTGEGIDGAGVPSGGGSSNGGGNSSNNDTSGNGGSGNSGSNGSSNGGSSGGNVGSTPAPRQMFIGTFSVLFVFQKAL